MVCFPFNNEACFHVHFHVHFLLDLTRDDVEYVNCLSPLRTAINLLVHFSAADAHAPLA